ncbi:MAG: WecB/TagA/CpsF family glycosyltransferase [Lachnospiraceae bacterium]|nr:WecB/TagA/CpsF family glycosyltransferase [Lachnospiraceae bacterium]
MQSTVNVMNVEIHLLELDVFGIRIWQYLKSESPNVILFASRKMLECAQDEEYLDILKKADLILPGEREVLSGHQDDLLEQAGIVVDAGCLNYIPSRRRTIRDKYTAYFLGRNEKDCHDVREYCERFYPNIKLLGTQIYDEDAASESVINEINAMAPDIILLDLESPKQEQWISEHLYKINTRLCMGIGEVFQNVLSSVKKPPTWIRVLHLTNVYKYFLKRKLTARGFSAKRFQKQLSKFRKES